MSKIGRNEPCPCGSNKKYKKCHPGEYDSKALEAKFFADSEPNECLVNYNYKDTGLATVALLYELPGTSKVTLLLYLCDIFCLGVKDISYWQNLTSVQAYEKLIAIPQSYERIKFSKAREIVLGSEKYAASLGFTAPEYYERYVSFLKPELVFKFRQKDYGRNDRPFYCTGPNDNYKQIFNTLEQNVGKGNFDYEIDERSGYVYVD